MTRFPAAVMGGPKFTKKVLSHTYTKTMSGPLSRTGTWQRPTSLEDAQFCSRTLLIEYNVI